MTLSSRKARFYEQAGRELSKCQVFLDLLLTVVGKGLRAVPVMET